MITKAGRRSGQALVESVVVLLFACLCFFALFQFASLFTAKAVLEYAAARGARARTVGFNHFMVDKSIRVATIPAAGQRLTPPPEGARSAVGEALRRGRLGAAWNLALHARSGGRRSESAMLPFYLQSINRPTAAAILDYQHWDSLSSTIDEKANIGGEGGETLTVHTYLRHPLLLALRPLWRGEMRGAADNETFALHGSYTIESHYPLYMEDMQW